MKDKVLIRLNSIERQMRSITRLVEKGRYVEVLKQLQSVRAAIGRVEIEMAKNHLRHCVEDMIATGDRGEQRKTAKTLIELLSRR